MVNMYKGTGVSIAQLQQKFCFSRLNFLCILSNDCLHLMAIFYVLWKKRYIEEVMEVCGTEDASYSVPHIVFRLLILY